MAKAITDIRYAVRQFRLAPIFTITAIFSLIHAVMLRSLPVANPESLYRIGDGYDVGPTAGPEGNWGLYSMSL